MRERVQIGTLQLTGSLGERFREACDRLRRGPTDLIRIMIEDWLDGWEAKGKPGWQAVLGPGESPPDRQKTAAKKTEAR